MLLIQISSISFAFVTGMLIILNIWMPPRLVIGLTYILFALILAVISSLQKDGYIQLK